MLQVALHFGNKRSWWLNGFRRLGVYSFGVYLVHPLVPPLPGLSSADGELLVAAGVVCWRSYQRTGCLVYSGVQYELSRELDLDLFGKLPGGLRKGRSPSQPVPAQPVTEVSS